MNSKKSAVIIGLGRIGLGEKKFKNFNSHFSLYNNSKKINLVAVVDVDKKKLSLVKRLNKDIKLLKNINELKKIKYDILSICIPTSKTYELVKNLSQNNLLPNTVFLEKPISYNLKELIKIKKILINKNIFINYTRLWDPKIYKFFIKKNNFIYGNVLFTKNLLNSAIHMVVLLIYFFGDIKNFAFYKLNMRKYLSYEFTLYFKNNFQVKFLGFKNLKYELFESIFLRKNDNIQFKGFGNISFKEKIKKYPYLHNYNYLHLDKKSINQTFINSNKYLEKFIIKDNLLTKQKNKKIFNCNMKAVKILNRINNEIAKL